MTSDIKRLSMKPKKSTIKHKNRQTSTTSSLPWKHKTDNDISHLLLHNKDARKLVYLYVRQTNLKLDAFYYVLRRTDIDCGVVLHWYVPHYGVFFQFGLSYCGLSNIIVHMQEVLFVNVYHSVLVNASSASNLFYADE